MSGKLNVLTFGAGAIGTYIGGSLALAGHQVVFLERPAKVDELRARGLRLDLTLDERRKTKSAFHVLSLTPQQSRFHWIHHLINILRAVSCLRTVEAAGDIS